MRRKTLLFFISVFYCLIGVAQKEKKYSAVNPALFLYKTEDVYINPPVKYNNGKNLIKPNPTASKAVYGALYPCNKNSQPVINLKFSYFSGF